MTDSDRPLALPRLITIPSSDSAFHVHVTAVGADVKGGPAALEVRLRRMFPRVVVRERALSAEPVAWYVYRDGGWRSPGGDAWWDDEALPQVVVTADGWLAEVSPTAAGLLGIDDGRAADHHFTDFVVPGTLDDAMALFSVIEGGSPLTATVLLRPTTGDVIAVDLHATRQGAYVRGVMRLAQDLDPAIDAGAVPPPTTLVTSPATDVAFRAYALAALGRMPEPTPDGLALRLRRLYPHASVAADPDRWTAMREPAGSARADDGWWRNDGLPHVRYDAQALIVDANDAARGLLGHELVGHYWQEFVTPGSSEQVTVMLEILGEVGAAESRFRMPRADGRLVEFDSYTTVTGEDFLTVMRPIDPSISGPPGGS